MSTCNPVIYDIFLIFSRFLLYIPFHFHSGSQIRHLFIKNHLNGTPDPRIFSSSAPSVMFPFAAFYVDRYPGIKSPVATFKDVNIPDSVI